MIHGLQPGPMLIKHHPTLFWGTVMSMYIGNVMCLIFNLPMISLWVQLLRVPYKLLYPLIILFCTIGAYSVNFSIFDIFLAMFFGLLGYFLRKGNFELAPLVLAFILSRLMEQAFRQSLTMSDGSFWIFFSRPISAIAMIIASASLLSAAIPGLRKRRSKLVEQIDD